MEWYYWQHTFLAFNSLDTWDTSSGYSIPAGSGWVEGKSCAGLSQVHHGCWDFFALDVFNERKLVAVMEWHASVVIDSGHIVHVCRETMAQNYSNLPGIRALHDFVGLHNSYNERSRELLYWHIQGHTNEYHKRRHQWHSITRTYLALGMVKQLSESKQGQLNQMCTKFIPQDRCHEVAKHWSSVLKHLVHYWKCYQSLQIFLGIF